MYSWHHRPCYDVIGFPYIRRRTWPIKDLPHLGLRVHFGSEFDCRVFVHARIDALMCPRFWSLLPSIVFDWVVIIWPLHIDAPQNTLTHPVSVISNTPHAIRTGLTSFRLVPVSTVPAVKVYIFGSVSPLGWHIILPRGTHHNFWRPWVGTDCSRTAWFMKGIPPWLKPKSASVWSDRTKWDTRFRIRRVSRLDWEDAYLATCGYADITLTQLH